MTCRPRHRHPGKLDRIGGSLDAAGSPDTGYVLRGGRMLESKYLCTYGLFSSIPTLDGGMTVTREIVRWNQTMRTSSRSRLALEPESMLGRTSIADQFDPGFLRTDFWFQLSTRVVDPGFDEQDDMKTDATSPASATAAPAGSRWRPTIMSWSRWAR